MSDTMIALNILRLVESAYHVHDPEVDEAPVPVSKLPNMDSTSDEVGVYRYLGRFQVYATGDELPFEPNSVIQVDSDMTVFDAFGQLVKHNVLSLPIRDSESGQYVGMIDMVDLVHLAVTTLDTSSLTDLASLTGTPDSLFVGSLASVANTSQFNPYVEVSNGIALLAVMRLLGERGLRRVCVVDTTGVVTGVISQSWLVRWLNIHKLALGSELMNTTVADLALVSGPELVVSVKDDVHAVDAFKAMVDNGVTSCAIVDKDDGSLITVLSVRDLKVLRGAAKDNIHDHEFNFSSLFAPVMDFVAASRMMNLRTFPAVVGIKASTSFSQVIAKFAATGLHRLFVIDDSRIPIGVVSLGDVIRAIPTRVA